MLHSDWDIMNSLLWLAATIVLLLVLQSTIGFAFRWIKYNSFLVSGLVDAERVWFDFFSVFWVLCFICFCWEKVIYLEKRITIKINTRSFLLLLLKGNIYIICNKKNGNIDRCATFMFNSDTIVRIWLIYINFRLCTLMHSNYRNINCIY